MGVCLCVLVRVCARVCTRVCACVCVCVRVHLKPCSWPVMVTVWSPASR
jgi:hypothetical protein